MASVNEINYLINLFKDPKFKEHCEKNLKIKKKRKRRRRGCRKTKTKRPSCLKKKHGVEVQVAINNK